MRYSKLFNSFVTDTLVTTIEILKNFSSISADNQSLMNCQKPKSDLTNLTDMKIVAGTPGVPQEPSGLK